MKEHKGKGEKPPAVTRIKAMKERGEEAEWPPIPVSYLTEWWQKIGLSLQGSMGETALTLGQIGADLQAIGITANPWEILTIRRMSEAFVVQCGKSEKPNCPAPYPEVEAPIETRRASIARRVEAVFRALAAEQQASVPHPG